MDGTNDLTLPELIQDLQISRICHLTPFRNLLHLAKDDSGLMSLAMLADTGGDFDQQDLARLDGHPEHISCSIEYPNVWYLRQRQWNATSTQKSFPDWVCLTFDPSYLALPTTRVCVRNAAAQHGTLIEDVSAVSLASLYAQSVAGAGGQTFNRQQTRLKACPTDNQAEVLIHRFVPYTAIKEIIVSSEADAKRMYAGLLQTGRSVSPQWVIAPDLFGTGLSGKIASGSRPIEHPWEPANA